jgi:P-aminobenzoate N-oxygenase AurF
MATAHPTEFHETGSIIGRAELNDLEALLDVPLVDPDEVEHAVVDRAETLFTWDYSLARPPLRKLYEKAKTGQWNATTDLPWDTEVDVERMIATDQAVIGSGIDPSIYVDTPMEHWDEEQWLRFGVESRNWLLSQFLHGEQGALICTAKIVETVPWYDAKLYASTQVLDEARHVEVFARYLDEKLGGKYPINSHLRLLLDDVVGDSRWDMTYLGMQVMVEGLALAAFGFLHQITSEPLLKQLLRYVMSDEARHVAFGVLSLREVYEQMSDAELAERQEFAFEAAVRMRDRFMQQEVWERLDLDARQVLPMLMRDPTRIMFQQMLFSKIVPNCKKLGLLDRNGQWLRRRFEEMGVIQFEDWESTGDDYLEFEIGRSLPAS